MNNEKAKVKSLRCDEKYCDKIITGMTMKQIEYNMQTHKNFMHPNTRRQ